LILIILINFTYMRVLKIKTTLLSLELLTCNKILLPAF